MHGCSHTQALAPISLRFGSSEAKPIFKSDTIQEKFTDSEISFVQPVSAEVESNSKPWLRGLYSMKCDGVRGAQEHKTQWWIDTQKVVKWQSGYICKHGGDKTNNTAKNVAKIVTFAHDCVEHHYILGNFLILQKLVKKDNSRYWLKFKKGQVLLCSTKLKIQLFPN